MALITCPDCKKKVSESANSCPKCGCPFSSEIVAKAKKDDQIVTGVAVVIVLGIILFSVYKCQPSNSPKSSPQAQTTLSKIEVWSMAQLFVNDHLKLPNTASYGGLSEYQDPDICVTNLGDGTFQVKGWVEAENNFGGRVRTDFLLKMKCQKDGTCTLIGTPIMTPR